MTVENQKTLDEIRQKKGEGRHKVPIPRDTRRKLKERDVILQIWYAAFEIKNKDKSGIHHAFDLPGAGIS
jgi:uncharacterized protein (UPF0254 family)